jgi:hypothetical protein
MPPRFTFVFYSVTKSTTIRAMEKIIEYKVTGGGNPQHLADAVNQLIREGFEPFGNIFQQKNVLLQPMVKKASDATPHERFV